MLEQIRQQEFDLNVTRVVPDSVLRDAAVIDLRASLDAALEHCDEYLQQIEQMREMLTPKRMAAALQVAMTDTKRSVDYSPLATAILADLTSEKK